MFSEPLITVSGYAKNTTLLSLNGRTIFTDEEGNFSAPLLLHAGHTIIEVRAENRFGRVHAEYREVVHEGKEMLAPSIDTNARATESAPNEKKTPH